MSAIGIPESERYITHNKNADIANSLMEHENNIEMILNKRMAADHDVARHQYSQSMVIPQQTQQRYDERSDSTYSHRFSQSPRDLNKHNYEEDRNMISKSSAMPTTYHTITLPNISGDNYYSSNPQGGDLVEVSQ